MATLAIIDSVFVDRNCPILVHLVGELLFGTLNCYLYYHAAQLYRAPYGIRTKSSSEIRTPLYVLRSWTYLRMIWMQRKRAIASQQSAKYVSKWEIRVWRIWENIILNIVILACSDGKKKSQMKRYSLKNWFRTSLDGRFWSDMGWTGYCSVEMDKLTDKHYPIKHNEVI